METFFGQAFQEAMGTGQPECQYRGNLCKAQTSEEAYRLYCVGNPAMCSIYIERNSQAQAIAREQNKRRLQI